MKQTRNTSGSLYSTLPRLPGQLLPLQVPANSPPPKRQNLI